MYVSANPDHSRRREASVAAHDYIDTKQPTRFPYKLCRRVSRKALVGYAKIDRDCHAEKAFSRKEPTKRLLLISHDGVQTIKLRRRQWPT